MRYVLLLGVASLVALFDQLSKWALTASLDLYEGVVVTGFFNLVHVRNYGAAFGFLNNPGSTWQTWLFVGATVLAAAVILWLTAKSEAGESLLVAALGAILGGAVGNLVDRLRVGAVVDFLDFHLAGAHWPAFNVADIAICTGAGLMALLMLRRPPQKN